MMSDLVVWERIGDIHFAIAFSRVNHTRKESYETEDVSMNEHNHAGGCACCSISRRCFLAASSAALAAPLVGCATRGTTAASGDLGEYIDLADLRPKPRVRIYSAVVRQKPPYWLGWPGTAYDLEGHRKEYAETFAKSAKRVGVELLEEEAPLESDDAVTRYVNIIKAEKPDAVLVSIQHLSYWRWADDISQTGIPTIIFAPIGTAFTQQVLEISRRSGVHVISSLETDAVEQAFRMVRAKHQLEQTRLLVVRGDKRTESALPRLGTTLKYIPRNTLQDLFARMPETDEVHEIAREMRRGAKDIVEPNKQDVLNAARSYITAKRLLRDEGCNAITTDCLGMVTDRKVPTPPCMAATLFQDAGITYGCEADLNAAMSLLLVSYLFDKPGFMQDPVPETVKNVLVAAHCSSATRLNGFDRPRETYIMRSHSESNIGVAMQVLWREGQPVTLVQFRSPHELILDTGTVVGNVSTPPAGGCRTSVEIVMDRMEDSRDVLGFHQVVFYGNHRRDVEAFCQMNGIAVVNSPEKAPPRRIGISLVTAWNVIGPFGNDKGKGHDTAYPPEREIDLDAIYDGLEGPVKWEIMSGSKQTGYMNFVHQFTPTNWVSAYALNYLYTKHDTDVQLRVGSNDTLKVWVDGAPVWSYDHERSAVVDNDVIPVRLKAGWTPVLLKVSQTEGGWGFYFRVTDSQGNAAKDVKCALLPRGD
ncbi:MAG: hypothetical protein ABIH23_14975 [bacterium]